MNLHKKTYFLITGASRGIGQTMAIRLSAKLTDGSVVALLARNSEGLAATKASIEAATKGKTVKVQTHCIDLATANEKQFQELLNESIKASGIEPESFQRAIIIHNAGTVGDVAKQAKDSADTAEWLQYYHMNVFSVVSLNCEFLRLFAPVPSKLVVNITSKCGIEAFASMSFYCSGKAAREMYFRVLAVEEEADTGLLVLNYAPGAIDTDMTVLVQEKTHNKELSDMFRQQRVTQTMLTTEQTTEKFIEVLEKQSFKSGDHVDYWD